MNRTVLSEALAGWLRDTFETGGPGGVHACFEIRPRFKVPGAGPVDFLTVRHNRSTSETKGDAFRISLWMVEPGTIRDAEADQMMRRLHAFQAWYTELLEQAETRGFTPAQRVSVTGNLVGASVRRSGLIDLLSNWGGSLFFWTWTSAESGIDVLPYYGKPPALKASRAQLKGLLVHLPWEDMIESEASEARLQDWTSGP